MEVLGSAVCGVGARLVASVGSYLAELKVNGAASMV
jgi:hypothetical protein